MFERQKVVQIEVIGQGAFEPGRIFCVGQNYEAHAREMGLFAPKEAPIYFTKTPSNAVLAGGEIAYPPGTQNLHHEIELAFVIGADGAIAAWGLALDMTRRDVQAEMRAAGRPWDRAKDFEAAAVFASMCPAAEFTPNGQEIRLSVNGEARQAGRLDEMVHGPAELIADLSKHYTLRPGDVILTGTPAGVGPVQPGDTLLGQIDGLPDLRVTIGARG
ncbi:MAG: fumarylacetoacetase [Rhodobacterales bacterium]|nr:MAG: fumarylacetoacetase [Rhodobacterales bacterium]